MPNLLEIDVDSAGGGTAELDLRKGGVAHFLETMTIVCYLSVNYVD